MKLEVGMYVRTETGLISKIVELPSWGIYIEDSVDCFSEKDIKASHNIIGIIQSKDLIIDTKNNLYVVDRVEGDYVFTTSKNEYGLIITLVDYQIKSIVTKEQFENMAYKVGE